MIFKAAVRDIRRRRDSLWNIIPNVDSMKIKIYIMLLLTTQGLFLEIHSPPLLGVL